jgi:cob(I)alamin adenosyltransferase
MGAANANAFGLALQQLGMAKRRVIQFLKWRKDTGEWLIKNALPAGSYEIYAFGRKAWLGAESKTKKFGDQQFKVEGVTDRDRELAEDALAFAAQVMETQKPSLLVLDEVNLAVHWGLLRIERVLELLKIKFLKKTTVRLNGSLCAAIQLIERADFVNVIETNQECPKTVPTHRRHPILKRKRRKVRTLTYLSHSLGPTSRAFLSGLLSGYVTLIF